MILHFTGFLIRLASATVHADDVKKNKKNKNNAVAVAPFIWGGPEEDVPVELGSFTAIKLQVPLAPFEWGNPEDVPQAIETIKLKNVSVPVAPFILGNPNEEISLDKQTSFANQIYK